MSNAAIASQVALEDTLNAIESGNRTILVDSPPGAGKSTLVRAISSRMAAINQVPIIVQTNNQADDMVRGFSTFNIEVGRLHGGDYVVPGDIRNLNYITFSKSINDLRHCQVVIATAAKWGTLELTTQWPFAIVDEAYQMRSDALLPVGRMMDRLLLVGDPGQLDPFTTADDTSFRGRSLSPIETAATTILTTQPNTARIALPVSWRLPHHATDIISRAFYQLQFTSGTKPGDRSMEVTVPSIRSTQARKAILKAANEGWAYIELDNILMPQTDFEVIDTIVDLIGQILSSAIMLHDEKGSRPLAPKDIAIGVTHRDQREHIRKELSDRVLPRFGLSIDEITVDTANKLQGREFEKVIVWHPLSGRRDADAFHLDAGRLCVLLSRHRHSCIVVSRGGIAEQLNSYPAVEPVWLGESPPTMDGWHAHLRILDYLTKFRI